MTIAGGTSLGGLASTSNATTFTSVGPNNPSGAANTLLICSAIITGGSGEEPPSIVGHGVSWSIVQSVLHGTNIRFITYQADGSGATSTKVTLSGWGTARSGCGMEVTEFTGINTTTIGVGSGNSVVQVAAMASGGSGTSGASNALAAYSHAANRPYGAHEHTANEATNVDASPATWVAGTDRFFNNPVMGLHVCWNFTNQETTVTPTWTTSTAWRTQILELNGDLGDVDATGSPDVVARSFTAPAASPSAASAPTLTVIERALVTPQASISAASSLTPTTVARAFTIGQASAQGGIGVDLGQSVETDEATVLTWARVYGIGQAVETDEATSFAAMGHVETATETDLAQPIDSFKGDPGSGIVRSPNRVRVYASHNEVT